MPKRMLIIESDPDIGSSLAKHFQQKDWKTRIASDAQQAGKYLIEEEFNPHVIIADLALSETDILDYLEDLDQKIPFSEWVFAYDKNTPIKIKRIEDLAYDCLEKPFEQNRLDIIVNRALRAANTTRRLQNYSKVDFERYQVDAYIGNSQAVRQVKDMLSQLIGVSISSMTITGETGTGKGLIARIIHHSGVRKENPLVEINCAALPKELLESQLFGHEVGAFTGAKSRHRGLLEQANGGTLFLDEISDLNIELQAKLLKAIEDKKVRRLGSEREISVDVQIIAATAVDLEKAVQEGKFREDLYHRLTVFSLHLPPLRSRKEDLAELIPRIIAEYNVKASKQVEIVPDEAWEQFFNYDWPGNIRELRNTIERCVLLAKDEVFPIRWLQLADRRIAKPEQKQENVDNADYLRIPLDGSMSLDEMDSHIIQTALKKNNFNITETARVLRATRETLRYRIQKYELKTSA